MFPGIPFGKYAVNAWHDENKNGKFDTRFSVIPLEGYGISNGTRGEDGASPVSILRSSRSTNITTTVPIAVLVLICGKSRCSGSVTMKTLCSATTVTQDERVECREKV